MTDYRAVVRHVSYWKGAVHRWSTSYSFTGSGAALNTAAAHTLLTADDGMCYSGSGETTQGGTYECEIYLASGGTPVASYTAFDWTVPGDWNDYSATGWGGRTANQLNQLECALLVSYDGGLGRTGKPVTFRKWYHAVPVAAAVPPAPDIAPAVITSLTAQALVVRTCLTPTYGLVMGNAGRLGTDITVSPYYSNHQMPKGRRHLIGASAKASSYRGKTVVAPAIPPVEED